jgi:hypothetical protein
MEAPNLLVGAGVGQGWEGALVAARLGDKNPATVAENARRPQD